MSERINIEIDERKYWIEQKGGFVWLNTKNEGGALHSVGFSLNQMEKLRTMIDTAFDQWQPPLKRRREGSHDNE